jgi:hypothetical protein
MVANGSVALGDVAARASHLDIACSKCDRKGRYQLARLLRSLGPEFPMTDLGRELADCPQRNATAQRDRCDVYFPNLRKIMEDGEVPG